MLVAIDPNARDVDNTTFTGFEDVSGNRIPLAGELVTAREPDSGAVAGAVVTRVDYAARLIYLRVNWAELSTFPAMSSAEMNCSVRQRSGVVRTN